MTFTKFNVIRNNIQYKTSVLEYNFINGCLYASKFYQHKLRNLRRYLSR